MAKIIIVEDNIPLATDVVDCLKFDHHNVEPIYDGLEAMELLLSTHFDLIILDWDLPGLSGIDILRRFRDNGGDTPVIMLTGKGRVTEKEIGLDSGADDYLTKPFAMKELSARVRAQLRRTSKATSNTLKLRDMELDPLKFVLKKNGEEIKLLKTEFSLLEFLMRHPNEPFTSEALLTRVWASDSNSGTDAIRSCLRRLRKKLNDTNENNPIIETVHGVGYRLRT